MRQAIQKTCTNCGQYGHSFRHCIAPVTSHGVIVFKVDGTWNPAKILSEQESAITGLEGVGHVKYLMIQRRDSLGFVELMRGKYQIDDFRYITTQLKGMTKKERNRFLTLSFNELWSQLWGVDSTSTQYRSEKETSRQKFEALRVNGVLDESGSRKTLEEVFEQMGPGWETPEYGFPKGRRDPNETERECALRELWEETGLRKEDIKVIENCEPLQETFFGSNQIHYCHKYMLAYIKPDILVSFDPLNEHMKREIGDLGWFTLEEALEKIRPENVEKKEVLLRAQSLLRNYCPLMLG
jgi:8-oxo-dGTP pyrophosphatase MutT (NUDIX family)